MDFCDFGADLFFSLLATTLLMESQRKNEPILRKESFLCMVFFCDFQERKRKLLTVESSKKDIGGRRYGPEKIMLQSCRKTAEIAGGNHELQKFINGGSNPENSAQLFLRSKRSSRINLAQEEIQIN